MQKINKSAINIVNFRQMDLVGFVFTYNNKILRAIDKNAKQEIEDLLTSGLIEELVEKKLFPETIKTDYQLGNEAFILKHKKIGVVTYPYEWSFSMVKKAAVTVLEVNRIARKYGYQTKDSHGFNIIFDFDGRAYFVDLGSFEKITHNFKGWIAYEEFIQSYYYPLVLWSKGYHFLAKQALANPPYNFPHNSFYKTCSTIGKIMPNSWLKKYFDLYYNFKKLSYFSDDRIVKKTPFNLGKTMISLKNKGILPLQKISFEQLIKQINGINNRTKKSMWDNYHTEYDNKDGTLKSTPRFDRITEILKELNITKIVEVGGNQGVVSRLLIQNAGVKKAICTDYDESAIDIAYNNTVKHNVPILPAIVDFAFPIVHQHKINAPERLKSQAVLGLALTHHLLLTQKLSLAYILEEMKKYTKQYIFIEFMPLGLYSKKSPNPIIPDWYTEDWFKVNFETHFNLLFQEKLDRNRILFVGKVKDQ